jgi:hypothetical protein
MHSEVCCTNNGVYVCILYFPAIPGWLHKSNTGFDKRVEKDDKPVRTILFACIIKLILGKLLLFIANSRREQNKRNAPNDSLRTPNFKVIAYSFCCYKRKRK